MNFFEELLGRLEDDSGVAEDSDIGTASAISENEAAVVQIVNQLIVDADRPGCFGYSHRTEQGETACRCVMRIIDGVCRSVLKVPASRIRAVVARIKVISRSILPSAANLRMQIWSETPRKIARAACGHLADSEWRGRRTEAAAIRAVLCPLQAQFCRRRNHREIRQLISRPHGIFLVVGPTGSGKTTTLHAILGHITLPKSKYGLLKTPSKLPRPACNRCRSTPR